MKNLKEIIDLLDIACQGKDWELVEKAKECLWAYVDHGDKETYNVKKETCNVKIVREIDFRRPLRSPYMEKLLGLKKYNGFQIVTYESEWGKLPVLKRTLKGPSLKTLKSKIKVKKNDNGTR